MQSPIDAPKAPSTFRIYAQRYQALIDSTTPYTAYRWTATTIICLIYFTRVFLVEGWYIVTYALGIYLLNLFLAFLSPKFDPALEEVEDEEGPSLPTMADEEFKPFIRRLPEFKFWYYSTRAFIIALICTFIKALDIPVFWPILLMYFLMLFGLTMRRQIAHMIRYKYIPLDLGKKKYNTPVGSGTSVRKE